MTPEMLATLTEQVAELVQTYSDNYPQFQRATYNETQVRVDFVNRFFKLLGWDVDNERGLPQHLREVTHELINQIGKQWETVDCEKPNSLSEWGNLLPSLDVWLNVNPQDIHYVVGIIPTLKWRGGRLGVRLIYQPRKIEGL